MREESVELFSRSIVNGRTNHSRVGGGEPAMCVARSRLEGTARKEGGKLVNGMEQEKTKKGCPNAV